VKRIDWVFLDLGGVLYGLDYRGVVRRFCRRCRVSPDQLEHLIYDYELHRSFESGQVSSEDFYRNVVRRLPCRMDYEEFTRLFNSLLVKKQSMFRVVHRLKDRVDVLVLSNTNEINAKFIDPDVRALTDKIIYSYQVGCMKPDMKIYEKALHLSGSAPDKTLFVDDRRENLEGARKLGIMTHHFQNRRTLLRALQSYGL
jgi:putative hydrolase of the HAD superfamily